MLVMTATIVLDPRSPFTRAAARRAGLTDRILAGPKYQRIFHGVYVASDVPVGPLVRALVVSHPDAHASHFSAARVLGVPVPTVADEHVTVQQAEHRRRIGGVRQHVRPSTRWIRRAGMRVSDPRQLFEELAGHLELVDLVVVGDHLVRKEGITCAQLCDRVAALPGRVGRQARRAAAYVRGEVDSPMESRLRMLLVLAGIPEPEVNRKVRAGDGEVLRRYDLSWPDVQVIVEYDGRQHIEREESWEKDLARREAIDDDGWRILVVTSRGIYRHPEQTIERVFRLLGPGGWPGSRPSPRRPGALTSQDATDRTSSTPPGRGRKCTRLPARHVHSHGSWSKMHPAARSGAVRPPRPSRSGPAACAASAPWPSATSAAGRSRSGRR